MKKIIKTNRLVIKPHSKLDTRDLIELLTNDEIKETYMIPCFKTKDDIDNMVNKLLENSLSDNHFQRGIYLDNKLIGFVNDVEIDNTVIELGYLLHPAYHNKGYATEMLQAVILDLLSMGFSSIVCGAFIENIPSIRVMQKCGMIKISKEDEITYLGIKRHCIYYASSIRIK